MLPITDTTITIRVDEEEKTSLSNILGEAGISRQKLMSAFVEDVNDVFEVVGTFSDDTVENSTDDVLNGLSERGFIQSPVPVEQIPVKTKLAFVSFLLEGNIKSSSSVVEGAYEGLEEEYDSPLDRDEIYLSPPQMQHFAYLNIPDALNPSLESLLNREKQSLPVVLRFMAILIDRMFEIDPVEMYEAACKEHYGEVTTIRFSDEDLEVETSAENQNRIQTMIRIPFEPLGLEDKDVDAGNG